MFKDPQRCTFVKLPANSGTKIEDTQNIARVGMYPARTKRGAPQSTGAFVAMRKPGALPAVPKRPTLALSDTNMLLEEMPNNPSNQRSKSWQCSRKIEVIRFPESSRLCQCAWLFWSITMVTHAWATMSQLPSDPGRTIFPVDHF